MRSFLLAATLIIGKGNLFNLNLLYFVDSLVIEHHNLQNLTHCNKQDRFAVGPQYKIG